MEIAFLACPPSHARTGTATAGHNPSEHAACSGASHGNTMMSNASTNVRHVTTTMQWYVYRGPIYDVYYGLSQYDSAKESGHRHRVECPFGG